MLALVAACGGQPKAGQPAPAPVAAAPAPPPARVFPRTLYALDVNGTRLTYRLLGDSGAPPVVFIHGSLGDYRSWSGQEAAFAQSYRVLVYSRRYHPPNPQRVDSTQQYSPKLHAEDLAALMLALDIAPAHIVGSGYGAYTALALARDHPTLVRSLVLAEPPILRLLASTEAGDAERRAFSANALDGARRSFARGDSVAALRAYYDGVYGRGRFDALLPAARADVLAHAFELRQEMLANREQYLPPVSCGELGRVTTPVLLVRGERSPRVFQLISDELARCLLSETTVVIAGAAHPPNAANGASFNQMVARFLASH
jgi:pimeloyl-ACP methyl ester carboxylesterase